jgi:hypothetical protein
MTPSCLPLITESDYPAFQRMIKELVHVSYQEWRDDHLKAVAYRQGRNGSREIALSPEAFDAWLKKNQLEAHLELLWSCVEDISEGQPECARAIS